MAYTKEILTLAIEIGDCMLRNGAEISEWKTLWFIY